SPGPPAPVCDARRPRATTCWNGLRMSRNIDAPPRVKHQMLEATPRPGRRPHGRLDPLSPGAPGRGKADEVADPALDTPGPMSHLGECWTTPRRAKGTGQHDEIRNPDHPRPGLRGGNRLARGRCPDLRVGPPTDRRQQSPRPPHG